MKIVKVSIFILFLIIYRFKSFKHCNKNIVKLKKGNKERSEDSDA